MLIAALVLGAVTGVGLLLIVLGVAPGQPRLTSAIARIDGSDRPVETALLSDETVGLTQKIGTWASNRRFPTFAFRLQASDADLDLIAKSRTTLMGEKVVAAGAGLFWPPVAGMACSLLGLSVPFAPPFVVGVLAAIGLWFVPDLQARAAAGRSRAEFARAVSTYLELLAIERSAGAGASQAASGAAEVAFSWPFERIAQALQRARWEGRPAWESLRELGQATEVPELEEVAEILTQAGSHGSAVHEQLQGKARSMREVQLATEVQNARAATARMWAIVPLTAGVYFMMLAFPAVASLLNP
jgi:pilus assembly protein TadC